MEKWHLQKITAPSKGSYRRYYSGILALCHDLCHDKGCQACDITEIKPKSFHKWKVRIVKASLEVKLYSTLKTLKEGFKAFIKKKGQQNDWEINDGFICSSFNQIEETNPLYLSILTVLLVALYTTTVSGPRISWG